MKNTRALLGFLFLIILGPSAIAMDEGQSMKQAMAHEPMHAARDDRISLDLPAPMKLHQLQNMRAHVEAVRTIAGLLAEGNYSKASEIAHTRLGLTDEMKKMCNSFANADFTKLGLAFHRSGDNLGDVLLTKDINKSLQALHTTMGYCVACHASYRQ